jgi:lysophospholipase L1-like esterase
MNIRVAVFGDSIAAGQGAARTVDSLASRLVAGLGEHGMLASPRVFAASGATSHALADQVERALPWRPDVAVIVIGANDLTQQRPPTRAAGELRDAVRRLRSAGVEVVVAPAPDLSTVPGVPPALRPVVRAASTFLRDRQISATIAEGGRIADRDGGTARSFASDASLFSADQFHPSSAGYAVIVEALLPEVVAAATGTAGATGATGAEESDLAG